MYREKLKGDCEGRKKKYAEDYAREGERKRNRCERDGDIFNYLD